MKPHLALGFTLIELMVTVAMIGIVLTIGLPAFKDTLRNNVLTAGMNEFVATLNFARSEAVKRGVRVSLAKTGSNWEEGWQVFTDSPNATNKYGTLEGTDQLLRVHGPLQVNYTLRGNNNFTNFISYLPSGESNNIGSFALCDTSGGSTPPTKRTSRLITVSILGRISLATDSNNDGILEKIASDGTLTPFILCTSP